MVDQGRTPKRPKARAAPGAPVPSDPAGTVRPKRQAAARPDEVAPGVPAPFTPAFRDQVNQGPLEAAYERLNQDPARWTPIPWRLVLVGVLIGLVFAWVNVYSALAVGIIVGGSWYVTYFIGMVARWKPGIINYVGGASTGASQAIIGAAFVIPVLFILSDRGILQGFAGFTPLYTFDQLPSLWALVGFLLIGGMFGVLFFMFYRRLWLVERPLRYPGGFDSAMELLAIAGRDDKQDRAAARRSIFVISLTAVISAFIVFLRDLRAFGPAGGRQSWLDDLFAGNVYREGISPDPWIYRPFYNGLFYWDPFFLAIGWFIRTRIAFVLLLGAVVSHALPYFSASAYNDPLNELLGPAYGLAALWGRSRLTLAAGILLGAGGFALFRLRGTIASGLRTVFDPDRAHERLLPMPRLLAVVGGGLLVGMVLLVLGGVPWGGALVLVPLATLLIAILGVVAVKVTGETAIQAVSPMTVISVLLLLVVLQLVGFGGSTLLILAFGAAAFFATGVVMSTDIFLDQKIALYVGNPPRRQAIVQLVGLVPGVIVGALASWYLAGQIVDMEVTGFRMPVQFALARIGQAFTVGDIDWLLFGLAVALGVFVEMATGMGTVFGIGAALQFFAPVTIFVGALVRAGYERFLAPRVEQGDAFRRDLTRIAVPTGAFVGASLAALVVFLLNQFVFN